MKKKIKVLIITIFLLELLILISSISLAYEKKPIYYLAVSGKVTLNKPTSYARVILTDTSGNEYLVYEAQGPFDSGTFSFEKACQETCVLDGVIPKSLKTELSDAKITIDKVYVLKDKEHGFKAEIKQIGPRAYQEKLNRIQETEKINKINQYIKSHHLRWTAGETPVSGLTYSQKKRLLGGAGTIPKKMPNLEGFEFYKSGIFTLLGTEDIPRAASDLPRTFDWRNRHGENWVTPVKSQGYCGSCWAFASTGAVEAATNLYYNQHLNIDLSEQDLVSCMTTILTLAGGGGCYGEFPGNALKYFKNSGATTESCFPYRATIDNKIPCSSKPASCKNSVLKIKNYMTSPILINERSVKNQLVKYGPLATTITGLFHAMVLVGWETDPIDERPVWIFKNSWGTHWGENGYVEMKIPLNFFNVKTYAVVPPITITNQPNLKIKCVDKDHDHYCNWGTSKTKPSTCPSYCKPQEDCDDSNPQLGPYDSHLNCTIIQKSGRTPLPDTLPPKIDNFSCSPRHVNLNQPIRFSSFVSDNTKVFNCELFINETKAKMMSLSATPCEHCLASVSYRPQKLGVHNAYIKCWDQAGNVAKSPKISFTVNNPNPLPYFSHWSPCDPTSGWKCGQNSEGKASCEGKHLGWGPTNYGEVICPIGTTAITGECKGKNDDFVKKSEARMKLVAHPQTFSDFTTFAPQSSWYCSFGCKGLFGISGLFCQADGCGWAKCVNQEPNINMIDLKIFDLGGHLLYNRIAPQGFTLKWYGQDNRGHQLASGTYVYLAKIYLNNGDYFETKDKITIAR